MSLTLGRSPVLPERPDIQVTCVRVLDVTARAFSLTLTELRDCRRNAAPRQVAMAVVRDLTGMSYPMLGLLFSRDKSTVMHAVRRVATLPELSGWRDQITAAVVDYIPPPAEVTYSPLGAIIVVCGSPVGPLGQRTTSSCTPALR